MNDIQYMEKALQLAKIAYKNGDVPIGAIIIDNTGKIIGSGYNTKEINNNSLEHAEMIAINNASKLKKNWRLNDCILYSTLEPCLMCTGAILSARIKTVVFGACDAKFGAVISKLQLLNKNNFNHKADYRYGILEHEIINLMITFFQKIRQN